MVLSDEHVGSKTSAKTKSISSAEQNYFSIFAMRYPVHEKLPAGWKQNLKNLSEHALLLWTSEYSAKSLCSLLYTICWSMYLMIENKMKHLIACFVCFNSTLQCLYCRSWEVKQTKQVKKNLSAPFWYHMFSQNFLSLKLHNR